MSDPRTSESAPDGEVSDGDVMSHEVCDGSEDRVEVGDGVGELGRAAEASRRELQPMVHLQRIT